MTTQIGTYADIYSIVIQPDDKIVAAGLANEGGISKFALARYNSDGTLDAMNFGTAGNPQGTVITQISTSAGIYSIALQDDGKIVAAGYTNAPSFRFALARYNQDGTLDGATFGTTGNPQGTVITQIGALSQSFAVLVQGTKIVAVGYTITSGIHKFAIARYTDNGSLDAIFNPAGTPQGINTTLINNFARSSAVALQQDGKIVLAGRSKDTAGNDIFALARYYGLAVTIPGAPSNLYGYQQGERYISQLDLVNYLYWRAATDTASYRIYSNDELVGTTSTTQFALHDIVPLKKTTYYVTSVDAVGEEGLSATITLG